MQTLAIYNCQLFAMYVVLALVTIIHVCIGLWGCVAWLVMPTWHYEHAWALHSCAMRGAMVIYDALLILSPLS